MLEHIRRMKAVHSTKAVEQPPVVAKKEPDEPADLSRREFFKRYAAPAAASVALSAIPMVLQTQLAEAASSNGPESIKQREAAIANLIREIQNRMKSPDVRAAMRGEGQHLVSRMLTALTTPLTKEMLRGTKYDMQKMYDRFYFQIATERGANGKLNTRIVSPLSGQIATDRTKAGMGSGAFVGASNRYMTARHVTDRARGVEHSQKGPDIDILNTGELKARPDQVLRLDPALRDEDIEYQLIFILGGDGKILPVIPMKMYRPMVERVYVNDSPDQRDRLARSMIVQLPPGEAEGRTDVEKPITGSSGGIAITFRGDSAEPEACGLLHSDLAIPDAQGNRTVSTGYIYGPTELNRYQQDHIRSASNAT